MDFGPEADRREVRMGFGPDGVLGKGVKMARLVQQYREEIAPKLMSDLAMPNLMQVPKLIKIVLNMGVGRDGADSKVMRAALQDMALIAGQCPVETKARVSVAQFKLRAGMRIGCRVTLRKVKMYEFFDRLVNIALPRVRDFRGLSRNGFDGNGNYNFGLREQIVFPEIDYDKIDRIRGMDIAIVTSTRQDDHAEALLSAMNFPIQKTA